MIWGQATVTRLVLGHLLLTSSSLVFCCFQHFSGTHSHLLSCLHLSTVHNLSLPSYHAMTPSFTYHLCLGTQAIRPFVAIQLRLVCPPSTSSCTQTRRPHFFLCISFYFHVFFGYSLFCGLAMLGCQWRHHFLLTPSMPAVPNCCCSKGSVPYWSNPRLFNF